MNNFKVNGNLNLERLYYTYMTYPWLNGEVEGKETCYHLGGTVRLSLGHNLSKILRIEYFTVRDIGTHTKLFY